MKSITDGTVPDALTTFDKKFYSSIGGFGTALENVPNTNRLVPIFEFRGLQPIPTWYTIKFARAVDKNVISLYDRFGTAPTRRKKRTSNMRSPIQRRDNDTVDNDSCDLSTMSLLSTTITSLSSAPLTTPSASPTPSSTDAPPPSTIVSLKPTCTVWLSNKPISIGNANEQDNGGPLRQQSFDAIRKHCPPSPATCDSDLASVDDIWTLVGGNMQEISVQFETQVSNYSDDKTFNTMLDAGLSTWQQSSTKSCKKVPKMNGREQNCDNSDPLKRDLAHDPIVKERAIGDGDIHYPCRELV